MNKFPRKYLNSREEGFYIMLEAALAYISGGTEETDIELKKVINHSIEECECYEEEKPEFKIIKGGKQ